jgi:thiamine transport system substrate-binding protein
MRKYGILLASLALIAAACGNGSDGGAPMIRLVTHDSFFVSDGVFETFTAETGYAVELFQVGDAGTMVNQAVLTKDNPIADVMFGIDNTFLGRALEAGIFLEYESERLTSVPDALKLDSRVTPIDFGDVCLNVDISGLAERGIPAPTSLSDLVEPAYRDLVAVEHPGTSSPGLAFMLATIDAFGTEGWLDYWAALRANGVSISAGWEEAYYGVFSGGAGAGDRPIVVSYASSPPAEVIFADPPVTEAPTAVVEAGCFRQIEFAGILAGTEVEGPAQALVDFMLGLTFQEDIPLNMFVFPANVNAELPTEFVEYTTIPTDPAILSTERIDANRERWIEEWIEVVTG